MLIVGLGHVYFTKRFKSGHDILGDTNFINIIITIVICTIWYIIVVLIKILNILWKKKTSKRIFLHGFLIYFIYSQNVFFFFTKDSMVLNEMYFKSLMKTN